MSMSTNLTVFNSPFYIIIHFRILITQELRLYSIEILKEAGRTFRTF
jgi:hypothetical protein